MSIVYEATENVYRRPYEFRSALAYSAAAFAMATMPVPDNARLFVIPVLTVMTGIRLMQGRRIRRYRKNLRTLPYYAMTPKDIPVSTTAQFMVRGFEWTSTHSQRLKMARMEQTKKELIDDGKLYTRARNHENRHSGRDWLSKLTQKNAWWNPVAPLSPLVGKTEIHGVEPNERDIWMELASRVGHMLVEGTTRVGKTRFAEILIQQDIYCPG